MKKQNSKYPMKNKHKYTDKKTINKTGTSNEVTEEEPQRQTINEKNKRNQGLQVSQTTAGRT